MDWLFSLLIEMRLFLLVIDDNQWFLNRRGFKFIFYLGNKWRFFKIFLIKMSVILLLGSVIDMGCVFANQG
jgi:hypothetical protein